jgi:protein TonB
MIRVSIPWVWIAGPAATASPSVLHRTATASSSTDPLSAPARHAIVASMLVVHAAGAWWLLHRPTAARAIEPRLAMMAVEFVVPLAPPPVADPPPVPAPPQRRVARPEPPRPVAAAPARAVEPAPAFVVPPPPVVETPAPPAPVQVVAVSPAPVVAPPPPAPAVVASIPPPPAPKVVQIGAVAYLTPPVLHYPPAARRAGEEGRVHIRVLVDATGHPRDIEVVRSSGHPRLDEAALATVRATRFRPYTENGVALPFRVVMPLVFALEG